MGDKPRQERGKLLRWLHTDGAPKAGTDPGVYDPAKVTRTLEVAKRLFGPGRYFEIDVRGMERVPPAPVMMVSNHSGGTTIPDVWGFGLAWYGTFGVHRPIHPMAHEFVMSTRATARFFSSRGVLRAGRGVARDVLTNWRRDLLVMPGGDVDTWRPYRDRYKVRFDGRTGYARTAIKAGVHVVPVANAGAHSTLYVLSDGRRMAEVLGIKKLARANVWPIHLSLPWGLTVGPWPHIPVPAKLRYRIGEPIAPPKVDAGAEPSDDAVLALDAQVRGAIQGLLDGLRDEDRS